MKTSYEGGNSLLFWSEPEPAVALIPAKDNRSSIQRRPSQFSPFQTPSRNCIPQKTADSPPLLLESSMITASDGSARRFLRRTGWFSSLRRIVRRIIFKSSSVLSAMTIFGRCFFATILQLIGDPFERMLCRIAGSLKRSHWK